MSINVKPGTFNIFREMSRPTLEAALESVRNCLAEFGGYPSTGMYNIMGVLQYKLGEEQDKKQAKASFEEALKRDSFNLNAWENRRFVCVTYGRADDADRCAVKVEELLAEDDRKGKTWKVRCLAEQGLAHTFNFPDYKTAIASSKANLLRLLIAKRYFDRAFRMDETHQGLFELEECCQWKYMLAKSLNSISQHYCTLDAATERVNNQGVILLTEVTEKVENKHYRAKALALLGTFLWKRSAGHQEDATEAEKCFVKARELAPSDFKILNSHASFLMKSERRLKDARDTLCKSLEMNDTCINWLAYDLRGRVYQRMSEQCDDDTRQLLEKSHDDFLAAASLNQGLSRKIDLGDVLSDLGDFNAAMEHFQNVVDSLGDQKNHYVHNKMGFCLRRIGHYKRAIESFKRAFECSVKPKDLEKNLFQIKKSFAIQCREESNPKHLVEQLRFWVEEGDRKHVDVSKILIPTNRFLVIEICKILVARGQHSRARKFMSWLQASATQHEVEQLRLRIDIDRMECGASSTVAGITSESILPCLSQPRNQNDKQYDCFIWHSDEDADWVYYSLLPRLEKCSGYKCCVPIRDMVPDDSTMELPSSVEEAACVVVILTSTFCKEQIRQVLVNSLVNDNVYTVIPLTLDENFIPSSLRHPKIIPYHNWERVLQTVEEACGCQ